MLRGCRSPDCEIGSVLNFFTRTGQGVDVRMKSLLKGMSMEIKSVMSPGQDTRARAQAASRACTEARERLESMERVYPLRDDPLYHEAKLGTMVAFVNFCEAMSLHDTESAERYRTSLAGQQRSMDVYKRKYFPGGFHGWSESHDLVLPNMHDTCLPACRPNMLACLRLDPPACPAKNCRMSMTACVCPPERKGG